MNIDLELCASNALTWAMARRGTSDYATRCLAFVEDAIERSNGIEIFGGDDAAESAALYDAAANSGIAPRGALVYFRSVGELFGERRNWGHVGLSLGDSRVIHAWDQVRIDDVADMDSLPPAPGWEPLAAVGWVPLRRVLRRCRPRSYSDEDAAIVAERMQSARFGQR